MSLIIHKIAQELNLKESQVSAVIKLLEEDSTVPFIARYRKEMTGGLDEVIIINIRDRKNVLVELEKRKQAIIKSLKTQEKYTEELGKKVLSAITKSELEDIYLPYKPKKRTRGIIAREKGLEPLAKIIFEQTDIDILKEACKYICPEKDVNSEEDALSGAKDIIAEWINEDSGIRREIRELFFNKAIIMSGSIKSKEEEGIKYKDYFDWQELLSGTPSHRLLAILRGTREGFLKFHIKPDLDDALFILENRFIKNSGQSSKQLKLAIEDVYKRLLSTSMETEVKNEFKKKADEDAIKIFSKNLEELLLASPLGRKSVLAIDPGFRTGCKVVCLDKQGKLIKTDNIYPLEPKNKEEQARDILVQLCKVCSIEVIAVGNGTGGREAYSFVKNIDFKRPVSVVMVNESGASVYSASEIARKEFPDYDVTVRGAVSIGRRLMDPLAELVKIDPKSIGVGQYQHDVDQKALRNSLNDTVSSCVNSVGVELNTASKQLLTYVSGLSEKVAGNIIDHRNNTGAFSSRKDLLKVKGMGEKTFEQSAGFLRITGAENPLDASAVHPESYKIVKAMAEDISCSIHELIEDEKLRKQINLKKYITKAIGMPTLEDIIKELQKPGRDPRQNYEVFTYTDGINNIEDLKEGMKLNGVVTNVTAFGAFVDIGVHQDGLVHISEMADKFVKNPHDIVKTHQKVMVTVLSIEIERKRISLSLRG